MSNGDLHRDSLREGVMRQINLTLSLAFLAPQLVKAAVESRLPRGINIERLRDPDPNWIKQFNDLGLDPD
jgi:site-specific DNA recombinase